MNEDEVFVVDTGNTVCENESSPPTATPDPGGFYT